MFAALIFGVALLLVIGAGALYQQWGIRRDRRRWPAPGRMIDIGNGVVLHVHQAGAGSPAVVLESGIAATTLNWRALAMRIAEFARVVSYDRAGLGFSGPARTPRTPSHIVEELRAMLARAGIAPPYVLVGHSFGALAVRWYAAHYHDEVAALVLVDALRPEDWTPLSEQQRRMLARGVGLSSRGETLARVGVVRACLAAVMSGSRLLPRAIGRAAGGHGITVIDRIAGEIAKMPAEVWPVIAANWSNPASFAGLAAHLRDLPAAIAEISSVPPLRGIPVTVITSARDPVVSDAVIRSVSPEAMHIVAAASGHWIHLDEPDLVLRVIREAVEAARSAHTAR